MKETKKNEAKVNLLLFLVSFSDFLSVPPVFCVHLLYRRDADASELAAHSHSPALIW
jgi:hypothetical protein